MDKKKREDICSVIMAINLIVTIIWIVWAGFLFFTSRPGSWKVVLIGLPISIILGLLLGAFYPGEAIANVDRKKIDSMDGIAFEGYCAQQLMKSGKYAKVQTTPPSGDFGADITAVDMNGEYGYFNAKDTKTNWIILLYRKWWLQRLIIMPIMLLLSQIRSLQKRHVSWQSKMKYC